MGLDVRTEDGNVATIDQSVFASTSFQGSATALAPTIVDTKFSPPPGESALVSVQVEATDKVTPAAAGGERFAVVRKSAAGVLTIAAQAAGQAILGDAGLVADLALLFTVTAGNTLGVSVAIPGYGQSVTFVGVLNSGATT